MNSRGLHLHHVSSSYRHTSTRWGLALALWLLALLALGGCANPTTDLVGAAQVNGQAISLDQYLRFVQINKSLCQLQNQINRTISAPIDWTNPARRDDLAAVRRQSLDELITADLTDAQATARHIAITPQAIDQLINELQQQGTLLPSNLLSSLHSSRDDLRVLARQALQQQAILRLTPTATTAEAHVAWIAVKSQATAEQVLAQLQQGASFEALAQKYSQDATRSTGGDAGAFVPGQNPPALESVIFGAPLNKVIGPVAVATPRDRLCFASSPGVEPPISAPQAPNMFYVVKVLSRDTTPIFNVSNQPNLAQDAAFRRWVRQGANIQVLIDF
ncbi:MAG TPA: peptidylprolyl isomerase [Ktedonobacterales bacterium]|jgi:peptidyl-prolyl cis-trans isomerase C